MGLKPHMHGQLQNSFTKVNGNTYTSISIMLLLIAKHLKS
jgi:hypothetical protein